MSPTDGMRPVELLGALCARRVDFVLIGGLAGAIRGTTRVTADIDLAFSSEGRNLERLCSAMNLFRPRRRSFGDVHGAVDLAPAILKRHEVVQLTTSVGDVDLLRRVDGFKSYGALKSLSSPHDVGGDAISVMVLTTEGLLKAKRALKRPKDVQDIVELEAIREIESGLFDRAPENHP